MMLTVVFAFLFFLPSAYADENYFIPSGSLNYSIDNTPSSWDLGMLFKTDFNDSSCTAWYLTSVTTAVGDDATNIYIINSTAGNVSLGVNASVTGNVALMSQRINNNSQYCIQAWKYGDKLIRENSGAPFPAVTPLGSFTKFCGAQNNLIAHNIDGTAKYTSIAGINISCTRASPPAYDVILVLKNNALHTLNSLSVEENDSFFIMANFTTDSVENATGVCNFTSNNITVHFAKPDGNISVNGIGSYVNLSVSEGVSGLMSDTIKLRMCKSSSAPKNLVVTVNGSAYYTIDNSIIPLCTAGYHESVNISQKFNTTVSFNVSVSCPLCTTDFIRIIPNSRGEVISLDRNFIRHNEDMNYNSTTKLYEYKGHQYQYVTSGKPRGSLNITCSGLQYNFSINVTDANLTVRIVSIDDIAFANGTQIESSIGTMILIEVRDDFYTSSYINVTYSNGTLIRSVVNSEIAMLNETDLNLNGIYNITASAKDDEGVWYTTKGYFQLNDTTFPVITWVNPSSDNTSEYIKDDTVNIRANFSDLNLFGFQLYVFDPFGVLMLDHNMSNINVTSMMMSKAFNFTEIGTYILNLTVVDDHTLDEIGIYDLVKSEKDNTLIFSFDSMKDREVTQDNISIQYVGLYDVMDIESSNKKDRYDFSYTFSIPPYQTESVKHTFKVKCEDIIFRPNSIYKAHFVCLKTLNWIDFESDDIIDWSAKRLSKDEYEVNLIMKPRSEVTFNSIGGLNIRSEIVTVEVVEDIAASTSLFNFDFTNPAHGLVLLCLVILYLGTNFIGFMFGNIIMMGLGMFFGMIIGIILASISMIFAIVFFIISIILYYSMSKMLL